MRRSLVVAQVALCTMLLVSAAGFVRTFAELSSSELGFEPANVLTARASLQDPAYGSGVAVSALYRRTLEELARLPGVEAAAVASNLPVERGLNLLRLEAPGGRIAGSVDWRYVTGDYLRVLRIPLVAGRAFGDVDHRAGAPPVAMVNEEYVRRLGSGRTVIGTRLQTTVIDFDDQAREVVGVLGDVRTRGVTATRPTVFVPVEQVPDELLELIHGFLPPSWALRTREGAASLIPSVERVIREADPLLSTTAFRSMDEVVGGAIAATRFRAFLLGLFAAAALTLAAAGLYGLVAYAVAQRTKEIGIRLALGASRRQVTARFALGGIALAALGAALGAGAAVLATGLLRRLTEAQPLDPWTVAGIVLVLGAVSAAATIVPARRGVAGGPDADAARRVNATASTATSFKRAREAAAGASGVSRRSRCNAGFRHGLIAVHRRLDLPAAWSARAAPTIASRRPSLASRSICASHRSASNRSYQDLNSLSSVFMCPDHCRWPPLRRTSGRPGSSHWRAAARLASRRSSMARALMTPA